MILLDHIIFSLEKRPEEIRIKDGKRIGQFWNEEGKRKHLETWHSPGYYPMGAEGDER